MSEAEFRCGFAALVGRPNTGKSTLLNALMRESLSIVTPKPQTTRHSIAGVRTTPDWQIIFVDTPGLHRVERRALNRYMNRIAMQSLADADVCLLVVEALRWRREDDEALARARSARGPVILVVNKIDRVRPRTRLLPFLEQAAGKFAFAEVVPVSARGGENLLRLEQLVAARLPVSPPLYPADQLTDRSEAFLAAELIREKLTMALHQELPYGVSVQIERYAPEGGTLHIAAVIWVERQGQKPIVLGRGGERLKAIGTAARRALSARLRQPVYLQLWIKVRENWSDNERQLQSLGYEQ